MRILSALLLGALWAGPARAARDARTYTLPAHEKERRYVLAELPIGTGAKGPFIVRDKESGKILPSQDDGRTIRVLLGQVAPGVKKSLLVEPGEAPKVQGMTLRDDPGGWISVQAPGREITRYHTGAPAEKHKKPFFYPLNGQGVNVLREYPVGPGKEGEAKDHPHHTGMYHAFGEVNGKEYWSKLPITPKKILARESGPAYARIVAENAWGEDLVETQDVLVLNAGEDTVVDWTITLRAGTAPVVFAKDLKAAKEGSFALRLAAGLSEAPAKGAKDFGLTLMSDAKGNKGENAIRADTAPWVDYTGEVDGKRVGVSVMNHPASFRYPTTWHVRAYGLFAANPWILKGENTLPAGESLLLRYRVYVHEGNSAVGKVADAFEGFTNATAVLE
ncbi:MAG TPA: PmoA family protein [Planctomycetota bacterium]|nr:PmoA family protein [Planctomycetota bacterium]